MNVFCHGRLCKAARMDSGCYAAELVEVVFTEDGFKPAVLVPEWGSSFEG